MAGAPPRELPDLDSVVARRLQGRVPVVLDRAVRPVEADLPVALRVPVVVDSAVGRAVVPEAGRAEVPVDLQDVVDLQGVAGPINVVPVDAVGTSRSSSRHR